MTGEDLEADSADEQSLYGNAFLAEQAACEPGDEDDDALLGTSGVAGDLARSHEVAEGETLRDISQVWFGFWKGLNAIYMGNGKFSGFRIPAASVEEIVDNLADAYNLHPSETGSEAADGYDPALEKDQITIQDVPGIELDDVDRANESALQALYQ